MDIKNFEIAMIVEKQKRFINIVVRTSKELKIKKPKIKFWESYCPDSTPEEIAHIHLDTKQICISNYWLKSLNWEEVEEIAIKETYAIKELYKEKSIQDKEINILNLKEEREYLTKNNFDDLKNIF
jgi:hypothetical protein